MAWRASRSCASHTYGLRAKTMRLFLRFNEEKKTVSDQAAFALPPTGPPYLSKFSRHRILSYSEYRRFNRILGSAIQPPLAGELPSRTNRRHA